MKRKPRIAVISNDANHGLAFQRGHLVFRHLKDRYDFVALGMNNLMPSDLYYVDAVVMLHPYSPHQATLTKRLRAQYNIPIVVDIDDLLDNLPSDHPEYGNFKSNAAHICAMFADHLVVSTDYLKQAWGHMNKNCTVIENAIDPARYTPYAGIPRPYKANFVVGWTGSQSHRPDLYNTGFIEGLSLFMEKYPDTSAHFHNLCPQVLLDRFGLRVMYTEKSVDFLDYPALCATFGWDLCAVPLHDHPFNRAKSDLRLLDFSQFSVPVLASPLESFVPHGKEGRCLLTRDNSDISWFEALEGAYKNRTSLTLLGEKARTHVLEHRSVQEASRQWDRVLSSLGGLGPMEPQ